MTPTARPPVKSRPHRARPNPYRLPRENAAPGEPPPIIHDVPLPDGQLAMQVWVTRLPGMPGWSQLQTRSGTDCRMSLDDLDDRERHAPGEVMRAALQIAVHLLPPEYHGPVSASAHSAVPLPDRLADLTARAMVDALATSCTGCHHRATATPPEGLPGLRSPAG